MAKIDVNVPDIGDFKDVPVIEVLVKPGDTVKVDQSLVTLESDKATMDVPSPIAGTVADVVAKVGDKVSMGVLIARIDAAGAEPAPQAPAPGAAAKAQASAPPPAPVAHPGVAPASRPGYGRTGDTRLLRRLRWTRRAPARPRTRSRSQSDQGHRREGTHNQGGREESGRGVRRRGRRRRRRCRRSRWSTSPSSVR